jgi:hypothetical protein
MHFGTAALVFLVAELAANGQTATLRADSGPPEDPQLRAEAVRLLEQANRLSDPATWPSCVITVHFRVGTPAPGDAYEGDLVWSVGSPTLRRQEWHYGAYQLTRIRNGDRLNFSRTDVPPPGILKVVNELMPIYQVHFDNRDTVRSIAEPAAPSRCIEFDTVEGDHQQGNQICVDGKNGWLLSIRTGDTTTRTSNFFPFGESFLPGHIERWIGGQMLIAIDQTIVPKNDFPQDFFGVPENTNGFLCPDLHAPYPVNTPQAPQGDASIAVIDVQLQGIVLTTGRVVSLTPVETTYPELNAEAVKLVSTWTFTPATCSGKPVGYGTTFTVHFKGR